jgi:protein gp37
MSTATAIEWTETTWNPTSGCDRISPGCDHCYALTLAKRLKAMGQPKYQTDGDPRTSGPGFGVALHPEALLEPLRWRKPRVCFVDSMADLMHAKVPADFLAQVWAVMALTPQHTYQILTKRPERYWHVLNGPCRCGRGHQPGVDFRRLVEDHARRLAPGREVNLMRTWSLPNVWLGTSIESDDYVWRADALRAAPAVIRFLSLEPLLGPLPSLDLTGIDWVIVGGESGPGFRPLDLDWVRDLRDRCLRLRIPLFSNRLAGAVPRPAAGPWTAAPGTSTPHGRLPTPPPTPATGTMAGDRRVADVQLRRRRADHRGAGAGRPRRVGLPHLVFASVDEDSERPATGTTVMVARALGRIGVGVDLPEPSCRLARWRVFDSGHAAKVLAHTWAGHQTTLADNVVTDR